MDVAPNQLVSVAASLILLWKTTMQPRSDGFEHAAPSGAAVAHRGAVVGTGMERTVRGIRSNHRCPPGWLVESVDSTRIVVKADKPAGSRDTGVDIYNLVKYQRSIKTLVTISAPSLSSATKSKPVTLSPTVHRPRWAN